MKIFIEIVWLNYFFTYGTMFNKCRQCLLDVTMKQMKLEK